MEIYKEKNNPKTKEFEEQVASICGTKHAVAMCNGTASLHAALLAIGVTKESNVYTLWYDGQSQGTASDSNEITGPTGNEDLIFRIGNHTYWGSTNYEFNGHISNMRVIKGTAIYTSAFTPSTSPLTAISGTVLLTCQNSTGTITDASSSNHTMTVYGNSIATSDNPFATTLNMGAGDWTIEWFMQISNQNPSTNSSIFDTRGGGPGSGAYHVMQVQTNRTLMYYTNGNSKITTTTVLDTGTWYHVALQKSGNVTTLYLDGEAEGTYADTQTYLAPQNNVMVIGADDNNSGYYYNGFLSNFRMVKGNTVYTPNGGSAYFDGTGDSLDVGTFTIGTDAFTIESWFQPKFDTNGSSTIFLYDVSSEDIRVTFKNGNIRAQLGSETELSHSIGSLDQNEWYHIALQRDSSGNVNFYYNGIDVGNYSASGQNVSGNTLRIGDKQAGSKEYTGYISNFRIVRGDALYPPANGGSASFDGSGDYLESASSLDFTMGTGDFTVECWFKPAFDTSVDNTYHAYMWEIGNQRVYITIDDGTLYLANAFIGAIANVSIGNIQNQWHHVAVTKASNVYTLWYDGQSQGTASDSNEITGPTGNEDLIFRIGNHTYWGSTNYEFNGHISNMRVIKGTAIYTSAFTPSTSPLTAISGTVLLTCQNSTGTITDASSSNHTMTVYGNVSASGSSPFIESTTPLTDITNTKLLTAQNSSGAITDASSNNHTVTANGNAQASSLHPFKATGSTDGSYYFSSLNAWNGTNARVITADSNDFNLPDGTDVTMEFWYKIPVTPPTAGNGYLFDLGDGNYGWVAAYAWNQNGTHTLRVGTYYGVIWLADEDLVGMRQNQWYHLAITRESGVWKVYLDGVFQGSKANSALGSFDSWPDRISLGGYHNMTYPNYGVVSYISDFRFVKGLAVYTGNFTPPSGPLTTTGGTYPSTANITNPTSAQTLLLTAQNSSGSFVDNSQYSRSLTSYNTVTTEAGVPN